ncbi:2-hydroxyacid dehydrogenase [Marinovum sp.]|uniref:2-hydroxyacid dehydrogenase n=1 Tax=Marinovum sp. TaxID=2024839 RepID=UPI002B26659C|nr:2-hydroxyacid dehydrogenase [Marinovum sp.]
MTQVLAIGTFNDTEAAALTEAFGCRVLAEVDGLGGLDQAVRDAVTAVAFKGHQGFGAAEMAQLPGLKLLANYGVGYDSIDVAAASAQGITVTNTPDVLNDDVADLAIALWLMQGREMQQAADWVRSGNWAGEGAFGLSRKLSGSKVGVVGLGRIGREIAERLAAFKCEVHYHSRSQKQTPGWAYHADPVALASAVDFLFIALVGGPETEGYVSKEVISALGPRGVIVNISRGSTVDETAMLDALEAGELAGAALDVFVNEPQIDPRFLALPNVVIQPHQGSATHDTRAAMARLQRDNIAAHLAGAALLTPVN